MSELRRAGPCRICLDFVDEIVFFQNSCVLGPLEGMR